VERLSAALNPQYEALAEKARAAKGHEVEETAGSPHGVLAWRWGRVNPEVAFLPGQASRRKAALQARVEPWAGLLGSDGYGVSRQWMAQRQTCMAPLSRRARGLAERQEPERARLGSRIRAERQRLVPWATAPPTSGEVPTW
jgi:transposase